VITHAGACGRALRLEHNLYPVILNLYYYFIFIIFFTIYNKCRLQVVYDILLEELGAVIKHAETGITMEPGDALRVTAAQAAPRSMTLRIRCAKVAPCEASLCVMYVLRVSEAAVVVWHSMLFV
jgi:hypothetical protein